MKKQLLIDTLSVVTASGKDHNMRKFIKSYAVQYACVIQERFGNIYITKGNAKNYPCLISHMDTVHDMRTFTVMELNDNLIAIDSKNRQCGIGGDDKNGVFMCLQALNDFNNIKLVFYKDEEIGCIGSDKDDLLFFDDVSFCIQPDRRGKSDLITDALGYDLCSDDFLNDIRPIYLSYGYTTTFGNITDVVQLKMNGLNKSVINLSCGYHNPHTAYEYVNISDTMKCYDLISEIIKNFGDKQYIHYPSSKSSKQYNSYFKYDPHVKIVQGTKPKTEFNKRPFEEDYEFNEPIDLSDLSILSGNLLEVLNIDTFDFDYFDITKLEELKDLKSRYPIEYEKLMDYKKTADLIF